MQRAIGYLMICIAILCWGLIGPFARFAVAEGVGPFEIAFWRAFFGGAFFVIQAALTGLWRATPRQHLTFCAFGIPGIALLFVSYQVGVQHSGAALTSVLNNTAPVWVAIWSFLFFKESMTWLKIVSIIMAIGGAALVSLSGGGLGGAPSFVGIAFGILSGVCYSLHYPFGKKYLQNVSPVTLYAHILPVGAICLLPFVEFMPGKSATVWLALIGLGFVSSWVAYRMFCEALKRLDATKVAIMAPLEPFVAAFFAYLWWDEKFTALGWAGAVLVVSAVLLSIKPEKKKTPSVPAEEVAA
jgi:Permeases of the drug/metabolite transporter (DMT) superfamily